MNPSVLPASSTGQCLACCGGSGRWLFRRGGKPTPGRAEFENVRTSMCVRVELDGSQRRRILLAPARRVIAPRSRTNAIIPTRAPLVIVDCTRSADA